MYHKIDLVCHKIEVKEATDIVECVSYSSLVIYNGEKMIMQTVKCTKYALASQ
jgi:hypothetical protein